MRHFQFCAALPFRAALLAITSLMLFSFAESAEATQYTGSILFVIGKPAGISSIIVTDVNAQNAVGYASGTATGGNDHAMLWSSAGGVDLNPSGANSSRVHGLNGTQQVGYANSSTNHAYTWSGTAASGADLGLGQLYGAGGNQQVGISGDTGGAALWSGTPGTLVGVQPAGYSPSIARGSDGTSQVGRAWLTNSSEYHAMLWHGTAASAVDLNPGNGGVSEALGVQGSEQVGYSSTSVTHAMLWHGTAASFVDLNPSGFNSSSALDTNELNQVGYALKAASLSNHAMLWSGTAASALDLHLLLPNTFTWQSSQAFDIDAAGNIYGFASIVSSGGAAVMWSPVPEPSTLVLGALGLLGVMAAARRRGREIGRR